MPEATATVRDAAAAVVMEVSVADAVYTVVSSRETLTAYRATVTGTVAVASLTRSPEPFGRVELRDFPEGARLHVLAEVQSVLWAVANARILRPSTGTEWQFAASYARALHEMVATGLQAAPRRETDATVTDELDVTRILETMPIHRGISWRAAEQELTAPVHVEEPILTSSDVLIASENFAARRLHVFVLSAGRRTSQLTPTSTGTEVTIVPGVVLVPVSTMHSVGGFEIQIIRELSPAAPAPQAPTDVLIVEVLREALRRRPEPVVAPGRFGHAQRP